MKELNQKQLEINKILWTAKYFLMKIKINLM